MDKQIEEAVKQMTDTTYCIYQNFVNKGVDPVIAGNMAGSLMNCILNTASKSAEQTISDIWGIYGGKAD